MPSFPESIRRAGVDATGLRLSGPTVSRSLGVGSLNTPALGDPCGEGEEPNDGQVEGSRRGRSRRDGRRDRLVRWERCTGAALDPDARLLAVGPRPQRNANVDTGGSAGHLIARSSSRSSSASWRSSRWPRPALDRGAGTPLVARCPRRRGLASSIAQAGLPGRRRGGDRAALRSGAGSLGSGRSATTSPSATCCWINISVSLFASLIPGTGRHRPPLPPERPTSRAEREREARCTGTR